MTRRYNLIRKTKRQRDPSGPAFSQSPTLARSLPTTAVLLQTGDGKIRSPLASLEIRGGQIWLPWASPRHQRQGTQTWTHRMMQYDPPWPLPAARNPALAIARCLTVVAASRFFGWGRGGGGGWGRGGRGGGGARWVRNEVWGREWRRDWVGMVAASGEGWGLVFFWYS